MKKISNQKKNYLAFMREFVFGMEDGTVSTFGSITGIALATRDPFTVILAGTVIIGVESISMSVGSYLSTKSEKEIHKKILDDEIDFSKIDPEKAKKDLYKRYIKDGWEKSLAKKMANYAAKNPKIFKEEKALHELQICNLHEEKSLKGASVMLFSYFAGGIIPLSFYFFFGIIPALIFSIFGTITALFLLGVFTAKFSNRDWWKAGFEMAFLAGVAGFIGYAVGYFVEVTLM